LTFGFEAPIAPTLWCRFAQTSNLIPPLELRVAVKEKVQKRNRQTGT